jgi:hypothetical protein
MTIVLILVFTILGIFFAAGLIFSPELQEENPVEPANFRWQ